MNDAEKLNEIYARLVDLVDRIDDIYKIFDN